jgi:RNA polymerase sigma-70 factor (ECF subfamily)
MSEASEPVERAETPDVAAILVANHREFMRFLERRVGDRAVAEDILQTAFVRGFARLEALRSDESVVAWFYRILRNSVIDHYRRRSAATRGLNAFAAQIDAAPEPEPEVHAAICRCVAELARTLKPEYAAILQRVEVDGATVKDFAVEAGISSGNAAVRIFRAREALRGRLARSCGTCAEHGCLDCTCDPSGADC